MPKESFERLLRLLAQGDSDAFVALRTEAERRGEVAGVVDVPFRDMCKVMEVAREERDVEKTLAVVKYTKYLAHLWAAYSFLITNWEVSLRRGTQKWAQLVSGGKWHQQSDQHELTGRCGVKGAPPYVAGPSFLEEIPGMIITRTGYVEQKQTPPMLCGRCYTQARKNWKEVRDLDRLGVEESVRKKVANRLRTAPYRGLMYEP